MEQITIILIAGLFLLVLLVCGRILYAMHAPIDGETDRQFDERLRREIEEMKELSRQYSEALMLIDTKRMEQIERQLNSFYK